jgi:signal transduction histidine kinase
MTTPGSDSTFQDESGLEGGASSALADVNRLFSEQRLVDAARHDERLRLARELHDGMLQSLTAAALQLEALARLAGTDPDAAYQGLHDIEQLIVEEQRALRTWIDAMTPAIPIAMATSTDLAKALQTLCRRTERQWSLTTRLSVSPHGVIPRILGDEVYRLVQESLTNIVRHARARKASVQLELSHERVVVTVEDDGCGFTFRGRRDLAKLIETRSGPVSIRGRLASLSGDLVVTSTPHGSRLEMSLPWCPPPR